MKKTLLSLLLVGLVLVSPIIIAVADTTFSEAVVIDVDASEALVVRRNNDAADVLVVDTNQDMGANSIGVWVNQLTVGSGGQGILCQEDIYIEGSSDEQQLTVRGNSTQTTPLVVIEDSAGTDRIRVEDNGQTRIGFGGGTAGTAKLAVNGGIAIGNQSASNDLDVEVAGQVSAFSDGTRGIKLTQSAGNSSGVVNTYGNHNLEIRANNATTVFVTPSSQVAVGSNHTSPDSTLDIKGGLTLRELSSDPANPDEGATVLWLSDGTGTGDDGDVMVKITAGGATKTITLVDFSAN